MIVFVFISSETDAEGLVTAKLANRADEVRTLYDSGMSWRKIGRKKGCSIL